MQRPAVIQRTLGQTTHEDPVRVGRTQWLRGEVFLAQPDWIGSRQLYRPDTFLDPTPFSTPHCGKTPRCVGPEHPRIGIGVKVLPTGVEMPRYHLHPADQWDELVFDVLLPVFPVAVPAELLFLQGES